MILKKNYLFLLLLILLGSPWHSKSQSECNVHRDTLYFIELWEQQFHSYPKKVIIEPNIGCAWVKEIERVKIDTGGYESMVKSLYTGTVFSRMPFFDLVESRVVKCENNYPREDYDSMLFRLDDQEDSLDNPLYTRKKSFTIYDDTFYFRDTYSSHNVVSSVQVHVYLHKLIVDYYVIPITPGSPIPTSTLDLQYKELPYDLPYRYRLKRIVKILPLEEKDLIHFK